MSNNILGQRFIEWAIREESVYGLVQIGSRVRADNEVGSADKYSDWDFQVISSNPGLLERGSLYRGEVGEAFAIAARGGRLGSAKKITILFRDGEIDIVVIPLVLFEEALKQVKARTYSEHPQMMRALEELSAVLVGGYRILKGATDLVEIYEFVQTTISTPRLSDSSVLEIAAGFVCDYVSTVRKIQRGEYLAAQRWLHHNLAEANFRLAHEFRQRANLTSFPDARRLEQIDERLRSALEVRAVPTAESLMAASQKSVITFRTLIEGILPERWVWPPIKLER